MTLARFKSETAAKTYRRFAAMTMSRSGMRHETGCVIPYVTEEDLLELAQKFKGFDAEMDARAEAERTADAARKDATLDDTPAGRPDNWTTPCNRLHRRPRKGALWFLNARQRQVSSHVTAQRNDCATTEAPMFNDKYIKAYTDVVAVAIQATARIMAIYLNDPQELSEDLSVTRFQTKDFAMEVIDADTYDKADIAVFWRYLKHAHTDFEEGVAITELPDMLKDFVHDRFAKIVLQQIPTSWIYAGGPEALAAQQRERKKANRQAPPTMQDIGEPF